MLSMANTHSQSASVEGSSGVLSNFENGAASKTPTMTGLRPPRINAAVQLVFVALLALTLEVRSASLHTLDGKFLEGDLRFNDAGALVITPAEGEPVTIELKDVARATFASGLFFSSGSILPNGWVARDIGEVRGAARLDTNTFALRVEGRGTNLSSCHFVSRSMHSDGELWARVERVSGNGPANAGIMIRSENNSAVFASLSLGNDGKLLFLSRGDPARKEIRLTRSPVVSAPILLRLLKRGTSVTAMYSANAQSWQTLAIEPLKISPQKTWREGEGELQLLRASCGVFVSSRGINTLATARVTPVTMKLHGLLGEYFADQDFVKLRLARLDPQIRFNWRKESPDPALDKNNFSVRWSGKIIAPKQGNYRFYFDADDRARLWINDMEMPAASLKNPGKELDTPPVWFLAGGIAGVKLEFENGGGDAAVQLGWALQGQAPEIIDMTNFLHMFNATNSPESIALARATNNGPPVGGVLLRDGTFVAGTVIKADESAVRLDYGGKKDVPVLNSRIARIHLRPSRYPLPYETARGRRGVFMKNGDFFESEFKRIEGNTLYVGSVLFGTKRFGIEGGDALVVVLNDATPPSTGFEVRLLDGSAYQVPQLTATADAVTIHEPILGTVSIPTTELFEIRSLAAHHSEGMKRNE
jgi:hypothetical protein